MSQESSSHADVYRKGLRASVAATCVENGCDLIRKSALETLTEIMQGYMSEVARNTRQYCEVGGRSIPTLCDLQASLADAGFKFASLSKYLQRKQRLSITEPAKSSPTSNPNVLLVGERRNFPNYVPENSEYPKFPDPHTYVRTLTGKEPEENYGILRERGSSQRWDVERALTKFIAKTGINHPLLPDDRGAFPVIAATLPLVTYQSALLPSGNDLAEASSTNSNHESDGDHARAGTQDSRQRSSPKRAASEQKSSKHEHIHNPYLRPPKMPKLKKRKR